MATEKKAKVKKPAVKTAVKKVEPKAPVKKAKSAKTRNIPEKSDKSAEERRAEVKKALLAQVVTTSKKVEEETLSSPAVRDPLPWEDPYTHVPGQSTDPYAVGEKPQSVDNRPRFAIEHEQIQKEKAEKNARIMGKPVRDGGMSLTELLNGLTPHNTPKPVEREVNRVNGKVPLSKFF